MTSNDQMKGCDGYILVCDGTNPASVNDLPKFYKQIIQCARLNQQALGDSRQMADPVLPLVLAMTKADLEPTVCEERMEELAAQYRCPIYRTSAKGNLNVDQAFFDIFRQIIQKEDGKSAKLVND